MFDMNENIKQKHRVAVTGGRDFDNVSFVESMLEKYVPDNAIVHSGGCRGVDTIAYEWAKRRGIKQKEFVAEWSKYGRSAGPIRNKTMIEQSSMLLVFPGGKGTANAKRCAERLGKRGHRLRLITI